MSELSSDSDIADTTEVVTVGAIGVQCLSVLTGIRHALLEAYLGVTLHGARHEAGAVALKAVVVLDAGVQIPYETAPLGHALVCWLHGSLRRMIV